MSINELEINFMVDKHREITEKIEHFLIAARLGLPGIKIEVIESNIRVKRYMAYTVIRAMGTPYKDMANVSGFGISRCRQLTDRGSRIFRHLATDNPAFPDPFQNFRLEKVKTIKDPSILVSTLVDLQNAISEYIEACNSLKKLKLTKR